MDIRIGLRKLQHNLWFGSAKTVNGLVIVAHNEQIVLRSCQKADNLVLELIDILKLINQNILIPLLPSGQDIFPLGQKLPGTYQQIIIVQQISLYHFLLVLPVYAAKDLVRNRRGIIMLQRDLLRFYRTDLLCQTL